MSKLLSLQEPFIVWLQSLFHPQADSIFEFITHIGGMSNSLFIWGFFIWCVSYSFGCRLVLLWLIPSCRALGLKGLVASPRPFQASSAVIPIHSERGFGFPSGHSTGAMITWGYWAVFEKKKFVIALAALFIFLIGLSRIYLGVHYPIDVIGGWVLGGVNICILVKLTPHLEQFFSRRDIFGKIIIILLGAAIILAVIYQFAPPGAVSRWIATSFIFYLSVCLGWLFQNHFVKFDVSWWWLQKILRFLIGGAVLFCLMHFSRKCFLFYSSAGLWLTLGAPALFKALRL